MLSPAEEERNGLRATQVTAAQRFRPIVLASIVLYACAAVISVVIAHILQIAYPQSGAGARVIAPVATGLEFLDVHWKPFLIMAVPLFLPLVREPVVRDLLARLRKIGAAGLELDAIPIEPVGGAREKPVQTQPAVQK